MRCREFVTVSFPAGPATDDCWLEHTSAALRTFNADRTLTGPVVLVLPAHLTLAKQIKIPRVPAARRGQIILFEAGQAIPHPLGEIAWDWVGSGPAGSAEDILLVAAKREQVEQLCAAAAAAGLRPTRVLPSVLSTLAAFRLVRAETEQAGLLLNIGGRSTNLLLVDKSAFAARTLALGGGPVTPRLAESRGGSEEEAEGIKVAGESTDRIAEPKEILTGRLALEVIRSVQHFSRQFGLGNPPRLILAGGGTRLAGLAAGLGSRLKLPVETCDVSTAVKFDDGRMPGGDLTDLVGAASLVLGRQQATLDLLPPALRRHEDLRRRQPWLIAAAVLGMAAWLPPILYYRQVAITTRARVVALDRALGPLREREKSIRGNLARLKELRADVAGMEFVQSHRDSWLRFLAALQERLAKVQDVWLDQLRPLPPGEKGPLKLALSGCLLTRTTPAAAVQPTTHLRVRELVAGLTGLPSVKAVEGERYDSSQPGLLRFSLVLVTDSAHPL